MKLLTFHRLKEGECRLRISEDVSHLGGVPCGSTGSGGDTPSGETICDGLKGGGARGLNLPDYPNYRAIEALSGLLVGSNHQVRSVLDVSTSTKANSSCLRSRQCGFGSFRDEFSFALGHQSENSDGESVHVGTVTADEVDLGVLETQ